MIRFNIDAYVYGLAFAYSKDQEGRITTEAAIFTCTKGVDLRWIDKCVAVGFAECHPIDQFKKETGRKLSLARALEVGHWDKAFRREFWTAYRERRRIS